MKLSLPENLRNPLLYAVIGLLSFSLYGSYLGGTEYSKREDISTDIVVPKIRYGDPVFDLKVTDANGTHTDIKSLIRPGRWSAIVFLSATCEPCT